MSLYSCQQRVVAKTRKSPSRTAFIGILLVLLLLNLTTACALAQRRDGSRIRERLLGNTQQEARTNDMLSGKLIYQGRLRTYHLHLPKGYNRNRSTPLVLAFHGGYGSGKGFAKTTGLNNLADREGFVVVYPDGIDRHWNDGRGTANPGINDVGFVRVLIDRLIRFRNIDSSRIYATGISNGGFFTQKLACEMSDKIAAFAPVAAPLPELLKSSCKPSKPISIVMINSPEDRFVPWKGGEVKGGGQTLSVPQTVERWRQHNASSSVAEAQTLPVINPSDSTRVRFSRYSGGRGDSEVVLYTIEGGGHTWPGGNDPLSPRVVGKTSRQISANEVIWKFFQRHVLS